MINYSFFLLRYSRTTHLESSFFGHAIRSVMHLLPAMPAATVPPHHISVQFVILNRMDCGFVNLLIRNLSLNYAKTNFHNNFTFHHYSSDRGRYLSQRMYIFVGCRYVDKDFTS